MTEKIGIVQLTPELMEQISKDLDARHADIAARYPALVEACPYEMKLAVTAWVMRAIVEHAQECGTFRYLIYHRLGFGPDAYVPLYDAGGMTISNEFTITEATPEDTALALQLTDALRPTHAPGTTTYENWAVICQAAGRLTDLSHALAAEQEKRRRVELELAELNTQLGGTK